MIKSFLSLSSLIALVFLGFWYWHTFDYQWYTVPVELSFVGGWVIVWGVFFK
ncbi:hypothetical protein LCGC14_0773680 [marine sediment metagenome]|uniref:Uncharacterized protein n=1 Tax=marine sediment metagenome TaxID=412755 RepID=A0A0F9SHI8_9ZZZZ